MSTTETTRTLTDVADPGPGLLLRDLAFAHIVARTLQVVADVGVADALGDEPEDAAELARRIGADPNALGRLLRLLAGHGVFARAGDSFAHTEASRLLRSDHPGSARQLLRCLGTELSLDQLAALGEVARTGRPALAWPAVVDRMAADPELATVFNDAMVAKSARVVPAVVSSHDFSPYDVVVDVAGGLGHLLGTIVDRYPSVHGVLFELSHVTAEASKLSSGKFEVVAGDFFVDPLPTADAYVLMEVLHDWPDEDAARILRQLRDAAPAGARLLIVENLVSDDPDAHYARTLDVLMLIATGGRERTRAEYEQLLTATGFRLERVVETGEHSIVEATVA